MATLKDIKAAVAGYFGKVSSDLTVNGLDLFLSAANQVRRFAELHHDFEFQRTLVTLDVNGTTGGSLLDVENYYDKDQGVDIKTIIDVGLFDTDGNLRPVRWDTATSSLRGGDLERLAIPRHPTDAQAITPWLGRLSRFVFVGNQVFAFPLSTTGSSETFHLGLEVYNFSPDWVGTRSITVSGTTGSTDPNGVYTQAGRYLDAPFYLKSTVGDMYALYYTGSQWRVSLASEIASGSTDYLSAAGDSSDAPTTGWTRHGGFTGTISVAFSNSSDVDTLSDIWLTKGEQYIQWGTIVQLNALYKNFVFRTEGNLPPPTDQRDAGLQALIEWDSYKLEQFRRR